MGPGLLVLAVLAWQITPEDATLTNRDDSDALKWSLEETQDSLVLNIELTAMPVLPTNYIVVAREPIVSLDGGVIAGQLLSNQVRVALPDTVRTWSRVHVAMGDLLRDSISHRIMIER